MQEISNISTILLLYIFIFFKYIFYSVNYFNIQFIMATIMIVLISWINISHDNISEESHQTGKFIGHIMFINVCFSLFGEIISFIYSKIFYYGFINSIILIYITSLITMSKLTNTFKEKIQSCLLKSNIGSTILNCLNYYYNTYIITKKYNKKIIDLCKYCFSNYIWIYSKIVLGKFIKINNELGNNKEFNIVKKNFNDKCSNIKQIVIEHAVQPYFIKTLQESLIKDPFDESHNKVRHLKAMSYKNSLLDDSIDMSFLNNTNLAENNDDFDDLDDIDLSNVPDVSVNQYNEENNEEINKEKLQTSKNTINKAIPDKITRQERRAMLRKKIKNKQTERNGNKNIKQTMKMPDMQKMMDTMLKGDNLEKIMKEFPMSGQNGIGGLGQKLDTNKMKKIIQNLSKNN